MDIQISEDTDFKIWWLLSQTRHVLFKVREKELNSIGTTATQSAILFLLDVKGDNLTPADLCRLMIRESNTISTNLSLMVKNGLIEKKKDLAKRNLVRIVMTEKGRQVYEKSKSRESIHYVMSVLSDEDRKNLIRCFETLRQKGLDWLKKKKKTFSPFSFK